MATKMQNKVLGAVNLSSKDISTWKKNVDSAISTKLVGSLKKVSTSATQLTKVTSGNDENDLSYRFNDLGKLSSEAAKQLSKFMTEFDSSLNTYIKTLKQAENTAAESMRKKIDQFAEAAAKISKLKM